MTELQGDKYYLQATETINKTNWILWGPTKSEKTDLAIDLYIKAANQYKSVNCYKKAGTSFNKAAELYQTLSHHDYHAASTFSNAAKMFLNVDKILAQEIFEKSIKIFIEIGNFNYAGKNLKMLAEMLEEDSKFVESITIYEKVVNYFELGNMSHEAMIILEKATILLINSKEYNKAIINFEKLAVFHSTRPTYYKTNIYILGAIILQLYLNDIIQCKKLLTKYSNMKKEFNKTYEYEFLDKIITAYECCNCKKFSDAVSLYNSKIKTQSWVVNILDDVYNKLNNYSAGEEDLTTFNTIIVQEEEDLT